MDSPQFKDVPLVGIMRGIGAEHMQPLADALSKAGLGFVEITMNTPGAPGLIFGAQERRWRTHEGRCRYGAHFG